MKFRICGGLDAPDWILAEIVQLAKLSSIRFKLLAMQVISHINDPAEIDYAKVKKLGDAGTPQSQQPSRVLECMEWFVPPHATVFFTADEDSFYAPAKARWGERLRTVDGGVFMPWSRGGKVDAATLGDGEEEAVIKVPRQMALIERHESV